MKRFLVAATCSLAAVASATGTSFHPIDLNRPGALDQVRVERPKHFAAISQVLRVAERMPCKDREIQSLRTRFDIRELDCWATIMTSYPPKRRVVFKVEDFNYVAVVTIRDAGGRLMPAN